MLQRLTNLFLHLAQSYLFIVVLALGAGLLFPKQLIHLAPFTTLFLQIVFFLTSLKLEPKNIFKHAKDWRVLVVANLFMLIVLPVAVFFLANLLVPSLAVALMLLAAMPSGMTSPLLVEVVKGNTGLALVLTLTTALLAPFTIPLVIQVLAGTAVTVSALTMFGKLAFVIILPFGLAQLVRHFWHRHLKVTFFTFKPISLVLLGLLIAGEIAKQAWVITNGFGASLLIQLLILTVFIALLWIAGYAVIFWRPAKDRLTSAVCLTFMNFTLAIYLAGNFFPDPNVLLSAVLIIFPWALLLLPFKYALQRFLKTFNL